MPGRIISKENEGKLRSALGALLEVLGLLEDEPDLGEPVTEPVSEAAIHAEYVPLLEKAVRRDGTIAVKIIQPGWGSAGYYPAAVLERDGPAVFTRGLQMMWDHPTAQEEALRPEGSLDNLAAELVSDARYVEDGPAGPGLYADAKVFGRYKEALEELAPHIGVSIRALGRAAQGEAEGRQGPVIQQITAARSVDFVTQPGAGGRVLQMFEAAGRRQTNVEKPSEEGSVNEQQFKEAIARLQTENQSLREQNARLQEAMLLRDARDFARIAVAAANVPDVTKTRLVEQLSANPPVKDGALDTDAYATRVQEAVAAEQAYLTAAAGFGAGRVKGMGSGQPQSTGGSEDARARLADAFQRLGLSEAAAQHASMR